MKVIKDFQTGTRRFRAGMNVSEDDFNGALGLADWQRAGYVEAEKAIVEPHSEGEPLDD